VALASSVRAQAPVIDRVFVIAMENQELEDIIGNPNAPYLNGLASQYGVATSYTAIRHPSLPNYMALTGGQTFFDVNCETCRVDAPNIADLVEASGRTWTAYMEGMTSACGLFDEGLYVTRHNPFVHYRNIAENPSRCARVVPFTRFAADLNAGGLANFVWITPDLCHDMHDCSVATGDAWLAGIVPSIVQSPAFANAVLVILWEEGTSAIGGGGRVPLIVVSPRTPSGTQSAVPSNHYGLLRTVEELWGLPLLGQSASARPLTEFFNLLQRPGFEEYTPPALGLPGWLSDTKRQTAAFSETHQPHRGTKNAACWTPIARDCGMVQEVIAPATGSYTLTMFANADRSGGLVGANVNASLAASAAVQVRGFANYGAPYTFTFPATAGDRIVVWMYSPASPGYVVLDDVSLVLMSSGGGQPPPAGGTTWTSLDVGSVGVAGSGVYGAGTWSVAGAGSDIWGASDAFHFVHQPLAGDGQITVRVKSLENTSTFAKAGIMLRDGLGANAAHVILDVRPTGNVEFMQRASAGGPTTFLNAAFASPSSWLRLSRAGPTVTASLSPDGVSWTAIGATTAIMPATIEAGLAVTSHDTTRLNRATFDGASVLPQNWADADIGASALTGNASFSGSAFTIASSGTNVWGAADSFHFVFKPLTGDGQIVARVASMQNTNPFAKVGVMMRDGLAPGAAHVVLDIRPTNDVEFMQRRQAGGSTAFLGTALAPPPYWLRLARTGGTITASVSPDGVAWTTLGSTPATMATTIQVGLIVTSATAAQLNTATVDQVVVR